MISAVMRRVVGIALVFSLASPYTAAAETTAQLEARLETLKNKSAVAGRAFTAAYWKLDETEVQLGRTRERLGKTEKRLAKAKRRLNKRANRMYRHGSVEPLQFVLASNSFQDFVTRADYLARIGSADAEVVAEVKLLRLKLIAQRRQLEKQRTKQKADTERLRGERDKLQAQLRSVEGEFKRVKRQLDRKRAGGRLPRGTIAAAGANGMVFPVVGSYYYTDTWGASRSGGRRRHQGTDIMAPHGTPCVAVVSGTISSKEGGLGGRTIWLRGDNGWTYYYAHLQGWAVRSGRVTAGQVIGYVGSTGNAAASAPHLHFEIHPGGGAAVNPYPYLRAME